MVISGSWNAIAMNSVLIEIGPVGLITDELGGVKAGFAQEG